jgi:hypothetical protein
MKWIVNNTLTLVRIDILTLVQIKKQLAASACCLIFRMETGEGRTPSYRIIARLLERSRVFTVRFINKSD